MSVLEFTTAQSPIFGLLSTFLIVLGLKVSGLFDASSLTGICFGLVLCSIFPWDQIVIVLLCLAGYGTYLITWLVNAIIKIFNNFNSERNES